MHSGEEIENKVLDLLEPLTKEGFELKKESRWQTPQGIVNYDIAILFKGILFAIVETKSSLNEQTKAQLKAAVDSSTAFYGIITDSKNYYLYSKKHKFETKTFDDIADFLIKNKPKPVTDLPSEIENLLKKQYFNDSLKKQIRESVYINKLGGYCYGLLDLDDTFERKLMYENSNKMQKDFYRYVPFDTAFSILKNNTYRMNGIAGMNDKAEVLFFENKDSELTEKNDKNNVFISSFSRRKDDLTMWRLYGDDGKGVCLVFTKKEDDVNESFWLYPVNYNEKYKKYLIEMCNKGFKINNIEKWICFFKNKNFKTENEVRLLVLDQSNKKEWYKTNDSSIINPYIEIDLNDSKFPLKLTKVILGPKCPESAYNKAQMESMLKDKNIEVSPSKIDIYR